MSVKKKTIASILAATTFASAAAVTVSPAVSNAASNADNLVKKAENLAGALKWEISVEYRKTAYPKNVIDYPNMKLFNDTKAALKTAQTAVSKLSGKEKTVLSAKLDEVNKYYQRSIHLIDAITAGKKIEKQKVRLSNAIAKKVDAEAVQAYHDLSKEIRKQAILLDRVYGQSTRDLVRDEFKKSAEAVVADAKYPVSVKIELDRVQTGLHNDSDKEVEKRTANALAFLKQVKNSTLKADLTAQLNKQLEAVLSSSNSVGAVKLAVENYGFDLTAYNKVSVDSRKAAIAADVISNRGEGFESKAEVQKVINASAAVRTALEDATQKVKAGNTTVDAFLGGVIQAVEDNQTILATVQGEKTEDFLRGLTSLVDGGFQLTKTETDRINSALGIKLDPAMKYKSYKQLSANGQKAVNDVLNATLDPSSFSTAVQAVVLALLENQLTQ